MIGLFRSYRRISEGPGAAGGTTRGKNKNMSVICHLKYKTRVSTEKIVMQRHIRLIVTYFTQCFIYLCVPKLTLTFMF